MYSHHTLKTLISLKPRYSKIASNSITMIIFFFLIFPFHPILSTATSSPMDFIRSQCKPTLYPSLCVETLSAHSSAIQQDPKLLVITSLSVSLSRAQSAGRFVATAATIRGLKPAEYRALKDCAANMANAVDQLSRSVQELGRRRVPPPEDSSRWRMNNVMSWVAAAATFQQTCLDGFSSPGTEGRVKVGVSGRVVECAHITSNSLALVHGFAARHKIMGTKLP